MQRKLVAALAIVVILTAVFFGQWYCQRNTPVPSNIPNNERMGYISNHLNVSVGITLNNELLILKVSMINNDSAETHIGIVKLESPTGEILLNVTEPVEPKRKFFRTYTLNVTGLAEAQLSILIDPQAKVATGISKTIRLSEK
ncbi:hypothetical protein APY94_03135 [Thermococcus celericrescens]|uniref:DUF1616 domain-containing protein n=1 Tax=Thermococcus celericrescens TaxID=227598 RepID=A0A117ITN2_9EURY|nr:hypothetical protein [Thermococcus celericrescens]KUH34280.1 hypothetical protein APY94_03135 [Thermococcus celericrescens]